MNNKQDFLDCKEVIIPEFYDKTKPPIPSMSYKGKTIISKPNIEVNVVILDVLSVNQIDSEFEVFYDLSFTWIDPSIGRLALWE